MRNRASWLAIKGMKAANIINPIQTSYTNEVRNLTQNKRKAEFYNKNRGCNPHQVAIHQRSHFQQNDRFPPENEQAVLDWKIGYLEGTGIQSTALCECGEAGNILEHLRQSRPLLEEHGGHQQTWPRNRSMEARLCGSADDQLDDPLCQTIGCSLLTRIVYNYNLRREPAAIIIYIACELAITVSVPTWEESTCPTQRCVPAHRQTRPQHTSCWTAHCSQPRGTRPDLSTHLAGLPTVHSPEEPDLTPAHILQDCPLFTAQRNQTRPHHTSRRTVHCAQPRGTRPGQWE